MKKYILSILCMMAATMAAYAQNAILEEENNKVEVGNNGDFYIHTLQRKITLLNSKAEDYANIQLQLNKMCETLGSFSGTITDKNGNVIRKIKKSELQRTEYSSELASDAYVLYLDITPSTYPVTVNYEYQITCRKSFFVFPPFFPQDEYEMPVKKATYTFIAPSDYQWNYSVQNSNIQPQAQDTKGKKATTFTLENLPAITKQKYTHSFNYYAPHVFITPINFEFFKSKGSLASWKDLGDWSYKLAEGRDWLTPEVEAKMKEATANCKNDKEKIAVLYKMLRENTRYVSIQLGIGGFQPMQASDTWKYAYGDCKALSNLMKAMLKSVGIRSNLVSIGTRYKRLIRSLPATIQMNHMILEVPLEKDTVWLECTNPEFPLGYIHDGISGHDALEFTEAGGRIVTLPDYPEEYNTNTTTVIDSIHADGSADITIIDDYQGQLYEDIYGISKETPDKQKSYLVGAYRIPQAEDISISLEDKKEPFTTPHFITHLRATSQRYANITGTRLFVPANPIHKNTTYSKIDENRKEKIYMGNDQINIEDITLVLPEGYAIEAMPASMKEEHPFGYFSSTFLPQGNQIIIKNTLKFKRGEYEVSMAKEINSFMQKVANYLNSRIVLKKQ